MKQHIVFLFIIIFFSLGCTDIVPPSKNAITLNCGIYLGESTKSIPLQENEIKDICIFLYNRDGILADCAYSTSTEVQLRFNKGEDYSVYAVANCGNIAEGCSLIKESDIKALSLFIRDPDKVSDRYGHVPMCYSSLYPISLKDGSVLNIPFRRCVLKINIKVDLSKLENIEQFEVTSVSIRNIPRRISLFAPSKSNSEEESFIDGKTMDGEDISPLFTSGVSFYMFENLQGNLLPNNTEVSKKVFQKGSPYEKICTYAELSVNYRSKEKYGEGIKYRFYLGNDLYKNFDLTRNNNYDVVVTPEKSGINEESWRIEQSNIKYLVTEIRVEPKTLFIAKLGETKKIHGVIVPSFAENRKIIWHSTDTEIADVSSEGYVTSISEGICHIVASSSDGTDLKDSCKITVSPLSISIPDKCFTWEGYTDTIIPAISNPDAVSLPVKWEVIKGIENVSIGENGEITGLKRGEAAIKVSFADYPDINDSKKIQIKAAVSINPAPYFELANYSLWPSKKDAFLPSSAQLNVEKAPNASLRWIVKRYGGAQRNDITVSPDGLITLGKNASGHYTIEAKASTGEFYSDYACADVYYYLIYQDALHIIDGTVQDNGRFCDITVSMGTRWYENKIPNGIFTEMLSKKVIVDSRDTSFQRFGIGSLYIKRETFSSIPYTGDIKESAYNALTPLSCAFETAGNYGNAATFRYDSGESNYYYLVKEGSFSDSPSL